MWQVAAATSAKRDTGISRRAWAVTTASAIRTEHAVTNAIPGQVNAIAKLVSAGATAMNAPRASLASAQTDVNDVPHVLQRVRCVIRSTGVAYVPSSHAVWPVHSVCPAPGAGRHVWAVVSASAITLVRLDNIVPRLADSVSAARATQVELATAAPLVTSAIPSVVAVVATQQVPLCALMVLLPATPTVSARASHSWSVSSATRACRAPLVCRPSIPKVAHVAFASAEQRSASRVNSRGAIYACRRHAISVCNYCDPSTCRAENTSTSWSFRWPAACHIARMQKYSA